jgi:hypothetical protein
MERSIAANERQFAEALTSSHRCYAGAHAIGSLYPHMCGRVIQSSGPLRYSIVDGMNVRDSRVHNYPPRWNAAPSQELLVIRRKSSDRRSLAAEAGFCAQYADDCPPETLFGRPLAEQARNRDHDSSDECEQARKQHNVTQEHTHTCASPSSALCGGHVGTPKQCRQPARRLLLSTCADCSPEFQGRRRAERPRRPSGPISSAAEGSTTRSISTADFLSRVDQLG